MPEYEDFTHDELLDIYNRAVYFAEHTTLTDIPYSPAGRRALMALSDAADHVLRLFGTTKPQQVEKAKDEN